MRGSPRHPIGPSVPIVLASISLVVLAAGGRVSAGLTSPGKTPTVAFRGVEYTFRWSGGTQYEFTPAGQEKLDAWTDMLTLNLYPTATTGEALAGVANSVLGRYQGTGGKIVRTNSVPATPQVPAEHFIAAVLPDPKFLEFAAARFVLIGKEAAGMVYSYRVYGTAAGQPMSAWMGTNGPDVEKGLMAIDVGRVMTAVKSSR
jgi:hypothetical protein